MALKLIDGKLINVEGGEKETIIESPKNYTESPKNYTESPKNFTEPNVMSEFEQEYNEIQDAMNNKNKPNYNKYDFVGTNDYKGIDNNGMNISLLYSQFKLFFQKLYGENELKDQFQKIEEFLHMGTSIMTVNNTKPQESNYYEENYSSAADEFNRFKKFKERWGK